MRRRAVAICLLGLMALDAGCARPQGGQGEVPRVPKAQSGVSGDLGPLRVAAASDLQKVLPRLAERFRERTGTTTTLTLDASGRLAEQIKAGAPFDVFLAANAKFVEDLAAAGLVDPGSVQPYARGSLVLCVHQAVGDQVRELADLGRPEVNKIAIANPEYAPYGVAARQALRKAGLWTRLEPKIVRADSVRQALTYAQNGDAEAALVGRAIADVPEVRLVDVDPALYDPLVQVLGIVSASRQSERAREFTRFVLGEAGQAILREFHFQPAVLSHGQEQKVPAEAK
jgi:molybdate transport system substrate-binding protein